MQGKKESAPVKVVKKRASTPQYVSKNQCVLEGFETPFEQQLSKNNRWVKLGHLIPWDKIVGQYNQQFQSKEGRPPISGRIIIGGLIIKHILNLTDRETILQIEENMFMQYFLGYSSFTNEAPFSATLFVEIRKRLDATIINNINDIVIAHQLEKDHAIGVTKKQNNDEDKSQEPPTENTSIKKTVDVIETPTNSNITNNGTLLMDATVAPQNITFPTDLKLLNAAREKSEELIDKLHCTKLHGSKKVRTYRNTARKEFLNTIKKKVKTSKEIYKSNGSQIRYLKRNLSHIKILLAVYEEKEVQHPLKAKHLTYIKTLQTVYEQQEKMHSTNTRSIENRIVNIHQPHVRPIKRGKAGKNVEFGSKLQVSLVNGFACIDTLSWNNFNEGIYLQDSVEKFKTRFGHYPKEVLADKIYCNRANRLWLKEKNIRLAAKPLGRPSKEALSNQVSPGERNPIEGKFGQAKVAYGLDNIKAKLKTTSESWIATIFLVLNLVNLTRLAALCSNLIDKLFYILFTKIKFRVLSF